MSMRRYALIALCIPFMVCANDMQGTFNDGRETGNEATSKAQQNLQGGFDPNTEFENYKSDHEASGYYEGSTGSDKRMKDDGMQELGNSEIGQILRESAVNNPRDKISWDNEMIQNSLRIQESASRAEDSQQCTTQTLSKSTFHDQFCEKESQMTAVCSEFAVVDWGEPEIYEEIINEETQEKVNLIIDKKVEALGQYKVLNEQSKIIGLEDGTTVADIIKRRRNKKKDPIKEIKKKKLIEKYDNPDYTKSFKRYQEEVQKKVRNYSRVHKRESNKSKGSYIERLRSGNSYKNLLKTLNVNQEELSEILSNDNKLLSQKEKERLLSMGLNTPIYTAPVLNDNGNKVRGLKRPTLTAGDYMLLDFLYRFSHSGLNTIALALGREIDKVANQINKLIKMACIKEQQLLGSKYVYYLSVAGYVMLTGNNNKYKAEKIKEGTISNKAITNYVGALLYSNKLNILDLIDYPQQHRYFRGEYYNGETVIPEKFYKSSLGVMANRFESGYRAGSKRNEIGRMAFNKLWLEWEANGKQGPSPEELNGNEFMYILYPTGILNQGTVIPDLVVKRDRLSDGKPQNIAVEIERENRKKEYYVNRLRVYQQDDKIYKEVVYIVNEKSVAKKLIEARDLIGFDRLRIVSLKDINGKPMPKIKDVWRLI